MKGKINRCRVGELRPSQLMFAFGIGSVVDLPGVSAMVMGLEDWDAVHVREIGEERLLAAVRRHLGSQVERLCTPPVAPDQNGPLFNPLDAAALIGVPVSPFPRWMRCPYCDLLAPLQADLFQLKIDPYRPDRTRYVHVNCRKPGASPTVLPARFLVACKRGHLDDFPWLSYVHRGAAGCEAPILRLHEYGPTGVARDVWVECEKCDEKRPLSDAFGDEARDLPPCRGRRPHLRDYEEQGCAEPTKSILLGASNSWFPLSLSAFSIPATTDKLGQLVEAYWPLLKEAESLQNVGLLRKIGGLTAFAAYADEAVWAAIEAKRAGPETDDQEHPRELKVPEWQVFSQPDPARNSSDFRLTPVEPPPRFASFFSQVVLVERLREVRALLGFTRIVSPGDFGEQIEVPEEQRMLLARKAPTWVPATEVRGEGIFIQFHEAAVQEWCARRAALARGADFFEAHRQWRKTRKLPVPEAGFPGIRYVLLHSFSHALMRQLALECGYSAAGVCERIYSRGPEETEGPMAGVLIYTAAPDSEGTLGGLVSLGRPEHLARHLEQALEQVRFCASDPLCAEHHPWHDGVTLHGAACHACLFAPETSCERGNKYLDRSVLVRTLADGRDPFFEADESAA